MSEQQAGKFGALASIMARNLEEIADLPDFKAPKPGVYKFLIEKVESKDIAEKTAIAVTYVVIDLVELNEPLQEGEDNVKPGDKFGEAFFFSDPEKLEQTLSVLKAKYGGLAEACGTSKLLEIMEKMEGMTVQGIVTNRVDKNDKSKIYAGTKDLIPSV